MGDFIFQELFFYVDHVAETPRRNNLDGLITILRELEFQVIGGKSMADVYILGCTNTKENNFLLAKENSFLLLKFSCKLSTRLNSLKQARIIGLSCLCP